MQVSSHQRTVLHEEVSIRVYPDEVSQYGCSMKKWCILTARLTLAPCLISDAAFLTLSSLFLAHLHINNNGVVPSLVVSLMLQFSSGIIASIDSSFACALDEDSAPNNDVLEPKFDEDEPK